MRSSKAITRSLAAKAAASVLALAITVTALAAYSARRATSVPSPVTQAERDLALDSWARLSSSRREGELGPLRAFRARELTPSALPSPPSEPRARSAIVVSADTGEILYEKNADERIPPASLTKLVAMYVALDAARRGELALDEPFSPPRESWAVNLPPRSSLMFLAEGQTVTARELLQGMASVSGNDAAIALAWRVSGSLSAFVDRMNGASRALGLTSTRFVEPSGLSEHNVTTPREFASFSLTYLSEFPEALAGFHSIREFAYPRPWNYPDGRAAEPIAQRATNRLLDELTGCDGLKTGYIDESGYNLSLTARRGKERYLAVLMGGPGSSSFEGNRIRAEDGRSIMEWCFDQWEPVTLPEPGPIPVTVWMGGTLAAIETEEGPISLPARMAGSRITVEVIVPRRLAAPIMAGDEIGWVSYAADGKEIIKRPLIADRSVNPMSLPLRALDRASLFLTNIFGFKRVY